MSDDEFDLNRAYSVQTPEDSVAFYRDWAKSYDTAFVQDYGYVYPELVARVFSENAQQDDQPVLDVGAGTGLVGVALRSYGEVEIVALDISAEMLAEAMVKDCYASVVEGDLTGRLPLEDRQFGALISAGTFTHGHVGPDAFDELLRVARPGALFVIGVNAAHFESHGFGAKFEQISDDIRDLKFLRAPIYEGGGDEDDPDRQSLVAIFRKSGG